MKDTDEIIRELTQEELNTRKPFAHFGWEGIGAFLHKKYLVCMVSAIIK